MNTQTQIIIKQLQKKDTLTVDEIAEVTKIAKPDVFGELRRLEKRGFGRLVIGRRGNPSRFVQKSKGDMEAKVNDLWKTKFANKKAANTQLVQAAMTTDWNVRIQDVKDGHVVLSVDVPEAEVGGFLGMVKARHNSDVH